MLACIGSVPSSPDGSDVGGLEKVVPLLSLRGRRSSPMREMRTSFACRESDELVAGGR